MANKAMKFWTADSDELVVDMLQCDQCDKWIPKNNWELHRLFHAQKLADKGDNGQDKEDNDIQGLPDFVMETIPCDDCHVLVPKANWEIHRAHVCRGRAHPIVAEASTLDNKDNSHNHHAIANNNPLSSSFLVETVECTACGNCVPLHNLELHETRACMALVVGLQNNDCSSSSPAEEENTTANNDDDGVVACPQCTFQNKKRKESKPSVWKCTMCDYVLAKYSAETAPQALKTDKPEGKFWQSMVQSWVPKEYHQLLPESMAPPPAEKGARRRRSRNQRKASKPSQDLHVPPRQELRYKRSTHLDWLERERQQYLQLLETTRAQYRSLKELETTSEMTDEQQVVGSESSPHTQGNEQQPQPPDNHETEAVVPDLVVAVDPLSTNSGEPQPPHQHPIPSQLELLKATEELCLYHLEHLRRTSVIQELKLDIQFLGLPRWRHHLHHLLDLYQSASEVSVDSIIWELRMNFIQYATLEVMALLELKIWKEQIRVLMGNQMDGISVEARRACRNDIDIAIICQSVIPFMGRPQTPALRSL